jgi:hypothetical protein
MDGSAAYRWISLRLWATDTASVRLMASSFMRIALMCVLAVPSVINSRRAMSLLPRLGSSVSLRGAKNKTAAEAD